MTEGISGEEEMDITEYFIKNAFPSREEVTQVIDALQAVAQGLSN